MTHRTEYESKPERSVVCVCECVCRFQTNLKVLKAEDVQDSDGLKVFLPFDLLVDLEDDPGETLGI